MENKIKTAVFISDFDDETRIIEYNTRHIIETSNLVSSLTSDVKYIPAAGDKIWFYPGCNIPRFKVKQFCNNNGVAVVKYKEKSSVKFIGPATIEGMVNNFSYYMVPKDYFLAWLETVMCNAYLQLQEDIIKMESDVVCIDETIHQLSDESSFGKKVLYSDMADTKYGHCVWIKDDESYQQIVNLMSDSNLRNQDDLLTLLNTGIIMDQKMYDDIHRLFASVDNENIKLAMEAMANCDFQKSAVYLLLLLKEYGKRIDGSGVTHHVNFKSLLKYFKIQGLHNISVDDMINALRHQKLLNVDNLNRLMPMAMEVIRDRGEMENIKIKDVELSTGAELSIAENILDFQQSPVSPIPDTPDSEHDTLFAQTKEFQLGT